MKKTKLALKTCVNTRKKKNTLAATISALFLFQRVWTPVQAQSQASLFQGHTSKQKKVKERKKQMKETEVSKD